MLKGKIGYNSEKGVTSPKMGKTVIQSSKRADPILTVAYFGEISLILKFYMKIMISGMQRKTSHLTEVSRQALRSSRREWLHKGK